MSKEMKFVPELRFPEFEGDGEWVESMLRKVYNFLVTNSFSRAKLNYDYGKVKNIHYGDIHTKFRTLFDLSVEDVPYINPDVSIEKIREECYCKEGDIIFADASEDLIDIGKSIEIINLNGELLVSGLHTLMARQNEKTLEIGFGGYLFKSDWIRKQIQREAQGAKVLGISTGRLSNIKISFPQNLKEQQKITSCLSSLDELITAHNAKLDALKDHKKGLLQNLFPQEGETVPKVRFPEFEGDGEWVEKTIASVSSLLTDYVANGSFQSLRENVIVSDKKGFAYYVRLVDLRAGLGHKDQKFVDKSSYQFLNKSTLNGGELLMSNIGANVGEVWQMPILEFPATLAPNMVMIKFRSQTTSDFVFQFLQSGFGQRNLSLAISGSGHPKINKTDLKKVSVGMPPTLEEQQKIASCLSAVDDLITDQQEKIEELQQHKKGLMQGLFPKIER